MLTLKICDLDQIYHEILGKLDNLGAASALRTKLMTS